MNRKHHGNRHGRESVPVAGAPEHVITGRQPRLGIDRLVSAPRRRGSEIITILPTARSQHDVAIFAPIVLIAHVLNISNGATKAAVVVYFFARLVHYIVYSAAIPAAKTTAGIPTHHMAGFPNVAIVDAIPAGTSEPI